MKAGSGKNLMQTGNGICVSTPVGFIKPVVASLSKITILLESWLATKINLPSGVKAKFRGVLPPEGMATLNVSSPDKLSTAKIAIESCPLFDP